MGYKCTPSHTASDDPGVGYKTVGLLSTTNNHSWCYTLYDTHGNQNLQLLHKHFEHILRNSNESTTNDQSRPGKSSKRIFFPAHLKEKVIFEQSACHHILTMTWVFLIFQQNPLELKCVGVFLFRFYHKKKLQKSRYIIILFSGT